LAQALREVLDEDPGDQAGPARQATA
jgi:hypothetical protein